MKKAQEAYLKFEAKSNELLKTVQDAGMDGDRVKLEGEAFENFKALQQEVAGLKNEWVTATALETRADLDEYKAANALPVGNGEKMSTSIADSLANHEGFKSIAKDGGFSKGVKTFHLNDYSLAGAKTMTTTNGYPPFVSRTGQVFYTPQQVPTLVDFVATGTTSQNAIKYIEETLFTKSAGMVAEGASKPAAGLTYTEVSQPVQKIAAYIKVTDEELEDVPQLLDIIRTRGELMVKLKLQSQLVNGTGVAPNLLGYLNGTNVQSASIADVATPTGSDGVKQVSIIAYARAKVNSYGYAAAGAARATAVVINPTDLTNMLTAQNTLGDFIWGAPGQQVTNVQNLWGLTVIESNDVAANQALVGDFTAASTTLWIRKGLTVDIGYTGTDFTDNLKTVRFEMRCANQIGRSWAFCDTDITI